MVHATTFLRLAPTTRKAWNQHEMRYLKNTQQNIVFEAGSDFVSEKMLLESVQDRSMIRFDTAEGLYLAAAPCAELPGWGMGDTDHALRMMVWAAQWEIAGMLEDFL